VLSMERMNQILEIDQENLTVVVEPNEEIVTV
jgi:FAD/FMN-containing dehydrogenase